MCYNLHSLCVIIYHYTQEVTMTEAICQHFLSDVQDLFFAGGFWGVQDSMMSGIAILVMK